MRKLYPLTHSLACSFAQSIYSIFSVHRPKKKTWIIKNTILNFSIFIYNLSMWLSEQVLCACAIDRYVFACTCTCTCKHFTYYCPLVFFIDESVRLFVQKCTQLNGLCHVVIVCMFRIHSSFGKFSAIPLLPSSLHQ